MNFTLILWTSLTILISSQCAAFLIDGRGSFCAASLPCTCYSGYLSCTQKHLTAIPNILPFPPQTTTVSVSFYENSISTIPADVFHNLSNPSVHTIFLLFSENKISSISDLAFRGIESKTLLLDLSSNLLLTIPTAIGSLDHLETLHLAQNPLVNLDIHVLAAIQRSLGEFSFSAQHMSSWPSELHILRQLKSLRVDHVPFPVLPYDAFHGFESTLQNLQFNYTNFQRIPENICRLKHLTLFSFNNNQVFNDHISFTNRCPFPIDSVQFVILEGNNISQFPGDVFATFPNLLHLLLAHNNLRYINSEVIPVSNSLTILDLSSNLFNSVPYAINYFSKLVSLDLSSNQIYAIDEKDFEGLTSLGFINLRNNPLEHVDQIAFASQALVLREIDLSFTRLEGIPTAIVNVTALHSLKFVQSPRTECSCDRMYIVRSWNVANVQIQGQCELSTETIRQFLVNVLPLCPS